MNHPLLFALSIVFIATGHPILFVIFFVLSMGE